MSVNVAIVGNPNCGKTTFFNYILGTNYRVANYPGVTVEKKSGSLEYKNIEINLTDLPGTYSLNASSLDEEVTKKFLLENKLDKIIQVIDATNMERNLYLTIQLLELKIPLILVLNMMDVAEKRKISINADRLSKYLGVPVVKTIARSGQGFTILLDSVVSRIDKNSQILVEEFGYGTEVDQILRDIEKNLPKIYQGDSHLPLSFIALKIIEQNSDIINKFAIKDIDDLKKKVVELNKNFVSKHQLDINGYLSEKRYHLVDSIVKKVVLQPEKDIDKYYLSDKIDSFLTHRIIGPILLIGILYFSYKVTFWASEYPINWIENLFSMVSSKIDFYFSDGLLKSLIQSGIIDGVGGVLGFAPLILLMFSMITILEDSGYMARVAHMLDRIFRYFNLQGNSVIPYIVSGGIAGGCAVPGVMATRTINGNKERLLTTLTTPFMVCGAKLPVLSLLIDAFFPGSEALLLLGFTLSGWVIALVIAKLFGTFLVKGATSSFLMELPPYRLPTMKGIVLHSWEKAWMYLRKAGTTILAISIILWSLMTFPNASDLHKSEILIKKDNLNQEVVSGNIIKNSEKYDHLSEKISQMESQINLKYSLAGQVGSFLEPLTQYAGFDWRTNIALLGGIAAKEVVVSALGTAYSLGEIDTENRANLAIKLRSDPSWNVGVSLSLIIFTLLYSPCFVTIVVIIRESGTIRWGLFTLIIYTALAFIFSVIVYSCYQAIIKDSFNYEKILTFLVVSLSAFYVLKKIFKKFKSIISPEINSLCGSCTKSKFSNRN